MIVGRHGEIGRHGTMSWGDVPVDAHFFSMFTKGHVLVMGRKTYESLPTKSLKDRTIVVVRREKVVVGRDTRRR